MFIAIACIRMLAQFTKLTAVSQPAGKPKLRDILSDIRQRMDHRDGLVCLAAFRKPAGELPPGMIVTLVGSSPQLINVVKGDISLDRNRGVGRPPAILEVEFDDGL